MTQSFAPCCLTAATPKNWAIYLYSCLGDIAVFAVGCYTGHNVLATLYIAFGWVSKALGKMLVGSKGVSNDLPREN